MLDPAAIPPAPIAPAAPPEPPTTPAPTPIAPSGGLPETGSDPSEMLRIALAGLGIGLVLVLLTRRPTRRPAD
jgi:hypothetical protein